MWENTNGCFSSLRFFTRQAFIPIPIKIQINNKTTIEFGSRMILGIIKASVCVI